MKISTLCKSCQKEIKVKTSANNRAELEMEQGKEITLTCNNCASMNKYHINRISAGVDNKILLISIVVGMIISLALIAFYGILGSLFLSIPMIVWQYQMKNAKDFNSYRVKR